MLVESTTRQHKRKECADRKMATSGMSWKARPFLMLFLWGKRLEQSEEEPGRTHEGIGYGYAEQRSVCSKREFLHQDSLDGIRLKGNDAKHVYHCVKPPLQSGLVYSVICRYGCMVCGECMYHRSHMSPQADFEHWGSNPANGRAERNSTRGHMVHDGPACTSRQVQGNRCHAVMLSCCHAVQSVLGNAALPVLSVSGTVLHGTVSPHSAVLYRL